MGKVKSLDEISRNYKDSVSRVPERYRRGVQGTTDWQERAVAGQNLYEQRMQDREVLSRRAKKLAQVSNEEWRSRAADVGATRIGQGMEKAVDKQRRGFAPFRETLANLQLPEKSADPMANIDNRAKAVVKALIETKRGQA